MTDVRLPHAAHGSTGPDHNGAGRATGDERERTRFRPSSRRRNRIAAGIALVAAAIAVNIVLYTGLDDRRPVVQVVRDVPAGEVLTNDMLRTVDVQLDGSVEAIAGDDLEQIVGQFAKVRLVSGSLVSPQSLQPDPLVGAGSSVLAIQVPDGALPIGVRERSPIQLVIPAGPDDDEVRTVEGRVVGLPRTPDSAIGTVSLTVEVDAGEAPMIAAATDVRVVLLEPRPDAAAENGS